jgi:hypothetical protein
LEKEWEGERADGIYVTWLAEQSVQPLPIYIAENGYLLRPEVNRKYSVDLSDGSIRREEGWAQVTLQLPTPTDPAYEHWIVLYCHAPVHELAGGIVLDWGNADALLFADGEIPQIKTGDFDIVCTYSPIAGRWQLGVVQYAAVEGEG